MQDRQRISLTTEEMDDYCSRTTSQEPSICQHIREKHAGHRKAHQMSGHVVGTLLQILATSSPGERRILEIGSLMGYSAAFLASAGDHAVVLSVDNDAEVLEEAKRSLANVQLQGHLTFAQSDGLDWLVQNPGEKFDMIFFDSDRSRVLEYFVPLTNAIAPFGVLVMDNSLLRGNVLNPSRVWEHQTHEFNLRLRNDSRFIAVNLPIRDGLVIARRKP